MTSRSARLLALAFTVLAWAVIAGAVRAGTVSFAEPPKRFQCLTSFTLVTKTPGDAAATCARWGSARADAWGCYVAPLNTIVVRDGFTMPDSFYGRLIKHEAGHACGWSAQHEGD